MSLYVTNDSGEIYVTTPPSGGIVVTVFENLFNSIRAADIRLTIDEAKELAYILNREIANLEERASNHVI
jgi:hypothetical protein